MTAYLDHASAWPPSPAVRDAMARWIGHAGSPMSVHEHARGPHEAIEQAREAVAAITGWPPESVVFTSGATEARSLALKGSAGVRGAGDPVIAADPLAHASALAAGCPVVVKPNPGHPRLSEAIMAIAQDALAGAGAPAGVLGLVDEQVQTGIDLVNDDRIEAVAFTGSQRGGLALARIAAERPRPIPFFGELGSINPMFVTAAHLAGREKDIATGFVGSFTLGAGQFCTKPGLLIAPRDEALRSSLVDAVGGAPGQRMLTDAIRDMFLAGVDQRVGIDEVEVLHQGGLDESTDSVRPTLMAVDAGTILAHPDLLEECFGPMSLLVEYTDEEQMLALADALPGLLAAGVHANGDESILADLLPKLSAHAGRVLWGGWPTGVAVTWSMQHGGPFPATTRPDLSGPSRCDDVRVPGPPSVRTRLDGRH